MLVCAFTLCIVVGCVRSVSMFTISFGMILSARLFCKVWCFNWVLIICMQLRQSVKTCAGSFM